jgi:thioredoxin 1
MQDHPEDLTLEELNRLPGVTLLEFGTEWCGYCQAARPIITEALAHHSDIRYIRIEDGKGKRLGRQFKVKLWPSLILLVDGKEVARCVRPESTAEIQEMLAGHTQNKSRI